MPTIQHLLRRWGFVKLRSYGLELTADGRILSTRPAVLDDGTGGRIVGWQDGDVSIWKLSRWSGPPRVGPEVASGVIPTPPAPAAAARPAIPTSSASAPAGAAPSRSSARVIPPDVAGGPTVDEDDWEWTIALARARVAVEETEAARPPDVAPHPEPPALLPSDRPTLRSSATADLAASGDWRKTDTTDTAEASAYDDYRISSYPLPRIVAEVALPRTTTPSTVIPVPALPTVDATRRARLEPVVRTVSSSVQVNRLAKGTGPVDPATRPAEAPRTRPAAMPLTRPAAMPLTRPAAMPLTRPAAMIVEDTHPSFPVGEHTTPGVAPATRRMMAAPEAEHDENLGEPVAPPAPSSGDRTKPGIALPAAAGVVTLPSIKRRAAR